MRDNLKKGILLKAAFAMLLLAGSYSSVFSFDLVDNTVIDGDWYPVDGNRADGRVIVTDTVYAPAGFGTFLHLALDEGHFKNLHFDVDSATSIVFVNLEKDLLITGSLIFNSNAASTAAFNNTTSELRTLFLQKGQTVARTFQVNNLILDMNNQDLNVNNANNAIIKFAAADEPTNQFIIRNAILKSDLASYPTWINLTSGGEIIFENVTFEFDPYTSSIGSGASDPIISFTYSMDNKFNAGFQLPKDIVLQTKHPFSGELNLNSYNLEMNSDIVLDTDGSLIVPSTSSLSADADGIRTLYFNSDQSFANKLNINSSITIDGGGKQLDLGATGNFDLAAGKSLTLKNIYIKRDLANNWFQGAGEYIWSTGVVVTE